MKDFNYKGYVLNIEELSKFHLSNIYDGNRYRGTSIINDKKQIKETSTIEILINWFKYAVDYLNETILYNQICKSWGSSYKRIEYKGRWSTITVRRRYKDSKVIYLGEFCSKDYKRCKSVENIDLDKVSFKFQKFVDEYCTDWGSYSSIPYKGYQLWISEEHNGNNYFGTCEIHKNSTFKCISSSIKEIETKFEARIDKILNCKEETKMTPKEQRIKELENQLTDISYKLEQLKKEIYVYKGVTLEITREKDNWIEAVIVSGVENLPRFSDCYIGLAKGNFERYIDDLEESTTIYCKLMGKEIHEANE